MKSKANTSRYIPIHSDTSEHYVRFLENPGHNRASLRPLACSFLFLSPCVLLSFECLTKLHDVVLEVLQERAVLDEGLADHQGVHPKL